MKKIALILLALLIAGGVYYFTSGSKQLASQMKTELNQELDILSTKGFSILDRNVEETKEHFVLSFDEPEKISQYLTSRNIQLSSEDAHMLKGLKLGVDVDYLPSVSSAVTFDFYPLSLPHSLMENQSQNKETLSQIQEMLQKKTFLLHASLNKLGSGFKGHMNDINEVLKGQKETALTMRGLAFSGELKQNKIHNIKQTLKQFSMYIKNDINISLSNLSSKHAKTAHTSYDYTKNYHVEEINFEGFPSFTFQANNLRMSSDSHVKDGLASTNIRTQANSVFVKNAPESFALTKVDLQLSANNLDIQAFERLQHIDVNNEDEMYALLQKLISKGVNLSVPNLSVSSIETKGKTMEGFKINAELDVDKTFDITALNKSPLSTLSAIEADLNIELSSPLFSIIAQDPKAMLLVMLFPPKDLQGKKLYKLDLKNGKLLVNGVPIL